MRKLLRALGFVSLAGLIAIPAMAGDGPIDTSINPFLNRALPVLVKVNTHGKVVHVQPAVELSPKMQQLLVKDLNKMVISPATENGRPISMQFIVQMRIKAKPISSGMYQVHFEYVKAMQAPQGKWHWAHMNGDQLALVPQQPNRPTGPAAMASRLIGATNKNFPVGAEGTTAQ